MSARLFPWPINSRVVSFLFEIRCHVSFYYIWHYLPKRCACVISVPHRHDDSKTDDLDTSNTSQDSTDSNRSQESSPPSTQTLTPADNQGEPSRKSGMLSISVPSPFPSPWFSAKWNAIFVIDGDGDLRRQQAAAHSVINFVFDGHPSAAFTS